MHILLILECKFVTVRPSNLAVLNGIVVVRVYIFGMFREYQSGFWQIREYVCISFLSFSTAGVYIEAGGAYSKANT